MLRSKRGPWVSMMMIGTLTACADGVVTETRATSELVGCAVSRVRYPTTREEFARLYAGRGFYSDGNHLGYDQELPEGAAIHPIACGAVREYRAARGYGTLVVVLEHRLSEPVEVTNGMGERVTVTSFLSIYGHLRTTQERSGGGALALRDGDTVGPDDTIGYVQNDALNGDGAEHLHLGIRLQSAAEAERTDDDWFRGYDGSPSERRWFADPRDFLDALQRSGVAVRWHPPGTVLSRSLRPDELFVAGGDDVLHRLTPADAVADHLADRVISASDEEIGCYATGAPWRSELLGARLVKFDDASAVYEDRPDGSFLTFISYEAFVSWGWRDAEIQVLPASQRPAFFSARRDGGFRRLRDGTLVKARGASEVSVISNGRRLPIFDWQTFLALGYRADRIVEVDASVIDAVAFARGPLITADLARYCARPSACLVGICDAGVSGGGIGTGYDDAGAPPPIPSEPPDAGAAPDAGPSEREMPDAGPQDAGPADPVAPADSSAGLRYEFRVRPEAGWGATAPYRLRDLWWRPQTCRNTGTEELEALSGGWMRCDIDAPLSPFVGSFYAPAHPEWGDRGQLGTVGNMPERCTPTQGVEWRITDLATGLVWYVGPSSGLPCVHVDTQDRHALP